MKKSAFGFDQPEESPGFLLWQTTITWQRLIKKLLDQYNLSHAQFVILAITLWFENLKQAVSQSVVIRQSKLDKMTVSKALKKLVALGYVKHSEHESDTRAKSVTLTNKGRALVSSIIPQVEKVDEDFFATLKKNERLSLLEMLNAIVHHADR